MGRDYREPFAGKFRQRRPAFRFHAVHVNDTGPLVVSDPNWFFIRARPGLEWRGAGIGGQQNARWTWRGRGRSGEFFGRGVGSGWRHGAHRKRLGRRLECLWGMYVCVLCVVCVLVRACVLACVRACVPTACVRVTTNILTTNIY